MRIKHYPESKLNRQVKQIVGDHLDLDRFSLFYFGSRVFGKGSEYSDIDIGIEGKKPVPSAIMSDISDGLENLPTLYTIEFVDFSQVSDVFKKTAKQHIQKIN